MKLFSIITVVLNDLEGLKKTHQSILKQEYKNYEWIVADGGSDATTIDFLQSLGDGVKWVSRIDRGIYDAMNYGVSMSQGEYIVFMNAGDIFKNRESLEIVSEHLLLNKKRCDVLFGGAMFSFCGGKRIIYRSPRLAENSLWHGLPANHQATYYRRILLDNTPYDLKYSLCGDYYIAARLMCNGALAFYLNEALAIFEVGGRSYQNLSQLFIEPYLIQRDVLGSPLYSRIFSFFKRILSVIGFVVLSQLCLVTTNRR